MTGITASPATNWTTGQYVTLGDTSKANWNGTAWVAGQHATVMRSGPARRTEDEDKSKR